MAKIEWTVNGKKIPWPPKPFPGYPVPIWEMNSAYIRDFIGKNKLLPARQEIAIDGAQVAKLPPWWKYGGPWGPHLHLDNEIYILDKGQWQEFSRGLVQAMDLKLKASKTIEFEAVMLAAVEAALAKGAK